MCTDPRYRIAFVFILLFLLVSIALLVWTLSLNVWAEPSMSLCVAKNTAISLDGIISLTSSIAPTHTWTQDTRADWESGTLESLDSISIPGSLQLARQHFSEPNAIAPSGSLTSWQVAPNIAVDENGNAYVVWEDERGNWDIYFAYRPVGSTWETDVRVNDDVGMTAQTDPSIAVDRNGNAYAVWRDQRDEANGDIYFAYRPSGGLWGANVKVNDDTGVTMQTDAVIAQDRAPTPEPPPPVSLGRQYDPAIAVDPSGNAYAVWTDSRYGDHDVYFAYRPVDGSWGTNVRINDDTGYTHQYDPAIAVDRSGNAYAIWMDQRNHYDGDVYFAYRPAGGVWSGNVRVNDDLGLGKPCSPAIAVDGSGKAYTIWREWHDDESNLFFAYRSADGVWSTNVQLNEDVSIAPAIATDRDGDAHAVWVKWGYNSGIVYAHYPADGEWGQSVRVSDDPDTALLEAPAIAADGNGNAFIVWVSHHDSDMDVYFARSLREYLPAGTYTSPVFDTRMITASWESLSHVSTVPAGTFLTFETRSLASGGNLLSPSDWSNWKQASQGSQTLQIASPEGRYLQYRITFSTTLTDVTPVLDQVQIVYHWAGAPSAPHLGTPCGMTNQNTPILSGSAAEDSIVRLYVDGSQVATQTVGPGTLSLGAFSFAPRLRAGYHLITVTAENENGVGPPSPPLSLTVNPTLAYDPINVRAGERTGDNWLLSIPRDANGCADPTNDWRVWSRPDQPFRVQIPVSYTTFAAVTVTLGTQTITLTEEGSRGLFVGIFQPPIQSGDFVIQVNADGDTITVTGGPLLIDPDGFVYEATGTLSDTIAGVTVTCYYSDTYRGRWIPWDAWNYQQINPQVTSGDGYYSFYTPRGTYRVVAEKAAYPTYTSPDLMVINTPVRHNIPLGYRYVYLPLILEYE